MKNTLDLLLHKLVIYYRAMGVKETCSLHSTSKERDYVQLLLFQYWVFSNTHGAKQKSKIQ